MPSGRVSDFASELEGSTKRYAEPVIVSERVYREVRNQLACRQLDIHPTGDTGRPTRIYTVRKSVVGAEGEAWELHNAAMVEYFPGRNFAKATGMFEQVRTLLPGDAVSGMMLERCRAYAKHAPPPEWDGAEIGETRVNEGRRGHDVKGLLARARKLRDRLGLDRDRATESRHLAGRPASRSSRISRRPSRRAASR